MEPQWKAFHQIQMHPRLSVFAQYEGLTVAEALKLKPDVATGATYTSEALIKNIQMGLNQAKSTSTKKTATKKATTKKKATKKRR